MSTVNVQYIVGLPDETSWSFASSSSLTLVELEGLTLEVTLASRQTEPAGHLAILVQQIDSVCAFAMLSPSSVAVLKI